MSYGFEALEWCSWKYLTARLEAIADPGCIIVNKAVADHVKGKTDFYFHPLGSKRLKNIDRSAARAQSSEPSHRAEQHQARRRQRNNSRGAPCDQNPANTVARIDPIVLYGRTHGRGKVQPREGWPCLTQTQCLDTTARMVGRPLPKCALRHVVSLAD